MAAIWPSLLFSKQICHVYQPFMMQYKTISLQSQTTFQI